MSQVKTRIRRTSLEDELATAAGPKVLRLLDAAGKASDP